MISTHTIDSIKKKLIKQPLEIRNYEDHTSMIYLNYIFKIYSERIQIINIIDDGDVDEEYVKITDVRYLNILLSSA